MILVPPAQRVRPRCYNRPAVPAYHFVTAGVCVRTGKPRFRLLWNNWFTDRCATWDGSGIGVNGERYPIAFGFDCVGCKWLPTVPPSYVPSDYHLGNPT